MLLAAEQQGFKHIPVVGVPTACSVDKLLAGVERIARAHNDESPTRPMPSADSPLSPANPPADSSATKPWWSSLVGPDAAATVTTGIAAMVIYEADRRVTGLFALAAVVFAVIYIVQMRFVWQSANWPKPYIHSCVAGAVISAALPSLKLILDVTSLGKFEVILDQAPLVTVVFLAAAVLFAGAQVYRERHNLHEKG
ncbi:hypothetical protein R5W24_004770 [Gemmata sp. JC717]|uniref:hypothetical protein n=1 Tax=Gemmata algarum TaxID=2975278 RepID=UPI0021BA7ED1|nr:hypothetical protein [Gemmata algarum]MDY3555625.1 hypothetical protein [Gemmata algarum]